MCITCQQEHLDIQFELATLNTEYIPVTEHRSWCLDFTTSVTAPVEPLLPEHVGLL
jgi:hypothetical protein